MAAKSGRSGKAARVQAPATHAQGAARPRVSVTGSGHVERAADVARATLVVEGIRPTAAEARAVAADGARAVLDAVASAGVAPADMHTAGIDVSPTWEHEDGRAVRTGFTVTNRVAVTIRDLERVGVVLDAALGAGATGLDGVSFALADRGPAEREARALAVADARARAATIAAAAGLTLGPLVGIAEGGVAVPMPRREARMMAMAADAGGPTPVIPGAVEVSIAVTAEWELVEG